MQTIVKLGSYINIVAGEADIRVKDMPKTPKERAQLRLGNKDEKK